MTRKELVAELARIDPLGVLRLMCMIDDYTLGLDRYDEGYSEGHADGFDEGKREYQQ